MPAQRYQIRPLGTWLEPVTAERAWRGRFRAAWTDTLDLLAKETDHLGAGLVVIQVDVTEGDLRLDGMLRANAKVGFPGIRVSFESKHGPLTYATDAYDHWQANVRAVALSLQALRAVDRYGVSSRGEQYKGWRQLESEPARTTLTPDAAATLLSEEGGISVQSVRDDPELRERAFKRASRKHHPDLPGGNADFFRLLVEARDLLNKGDR